jgi:hypothetical protein
LIRDGKKAARQLPDIHKKRFVFRKTYSEQILEPSQVHEFHSILKAHVKNIILFFTELVYYAFIQPWWNPVPNLG